MYQGVNGQAYHVTIPEAHSSPQTQRGDTSRKKRPVPLTVSSPSLVSSDKQTSPSKSYAPCNPSPVTHYAPPQSPSAPPSRDQRSQLRPSIPYRPTYTNSQSASPMETQHSPWADPKRGLASPRQGQQLNPDPVRSETLIASYSTPAGQTEVMVSMHNGKQYIYNSSTTVNHSPTSFQADPAHLKTRFQATCQTASSTSSSSPSSNGSSSSTSSASLSTKAALRRRFNTLHAQR